VFGNSTVEQPIQIRGHFIPAILWEPLIDGRAPRSGVHHMHKLALAHRSFPRSTGLLSCGKYQLSHHVWEFGCRRLVATAHGYWQF
jgi:hypothetical protein